MNFEFSYSDIIKQCYGMAYLNVVSFCLLSGCGSIELPDEQELNHIYELLKGIDSKAMPKNIAFMSSLYKKCLPLYAAVPESPYDFKGFRWTNKKMKKVIEPNVLAHSICCMTALIPIILNEEIRLDKKDFTAYCLGVSSLKQARFIIDFLKLGDFYYTGVDAGDNTYGEYNIQINSENPDLRTQFYVAEALSSAARLLKDSSLYPHEQYAGLEKNLDILPVICENVIENINDMSSRDMSVICLSLLATLKQTERHSDIIYNTANSIGFELCERLAGTGDISRNIYDDSSSSFITLCNCLNCLVKLHEVNPIEKYESAYLKLYDRIDSYWDSGSGLFITTGKSKQKFSFKEVSAILAALRAFRCSLANPDLYMHADRQLSSFYSSALVKSKLFNSQFYPILQEFKLELNIPGSTDKNSPPVFAEAFEVKQNKRKYYCKPGVFQSEEVLSGCRNLLY